MNKVDSLNITLNRKALPLDVKPMNNAKIGLFTGNSIQVNIDEIELSKQNNNKQNDAKDDNRKKWVIGAGIFLGIAAVASLAFVLCKAQNAKKILDKGIDLAKDAKQIPMEPLKTNGSTGIIGELLETSTPKEKILENFVTDNEFINKGLSFVESRMDDVTSATAEVLSSADPAKKIQTVIELSGTGPTKFAQIISNDVDIMSAIDDKMPVLGEAIRKTKTECNPSRTLEEASEFLKECFPEKGFQLKKELGVGSIGASYLAQDSNGKDIVVKMIKKGVTVESLKEEENLLVKALSNICSGEELVKKESMLRELYSSWIKELDLTQCLEYNQKFSSGAKRYSVAKVLEVSKNGQCLVMNMAEGLQMDKLISVLKDYKVNPTDFKVKYADLIKEHPWLAQPEKVIKELPEVLTKSFSEQFLFLKKGGTSMMHGDPHTGNFFIKMSEKGRLIPEFIDTDNCVMRYGAQVKSDINMFMNYLVGNSDKVAEYFVNLSDCNPGDKSKYIKIISEELKKNIFGKKCNITDYSTAIDNINAILKKQGLNISLMNSTALKSQFQFMKVITETNKLAGNKYDINFITLIMDIPRAIYDMFKAKVNPFECIKGVLPYSFNNLEQAVSCAGQFFI